MTVWHAAIQQHTNGILCSSAIKDINTKASFKSHILIIYVFTDGTVSLKWIIISKSHIFSLRIDGTVPLKELGTP